MVFCTYLKNSHRLNLKTFFLMVLINCVSVYNNNRGSNACSTNLCHTVYMGASKSFETAQNQIRSVCRCYTFPLNSPSNLKHYILHVVGTEKVKQFDYTKTNKNINNRFANLNVKIFREVMINPVLKMIPHTQFCLSALHMCLLYILC